MKIFTKGFKPEMIKIIQEIHKKSQGSIHWRWTYWLRERKERRRERGNR